MKKFKAYNIAYDFLLLYGIVIHNVTKQP